MDKITNIQYWELLEKLSNWLLLEEGLSSKKLVNLDQ
jgi:hypothetical protein